MTRKSGLDRVVFSTTINPVTKEAIASFADDIDKPLGQALDTILEEWKFMSRQRMGDNQSLEDRMDNLASQVCSLRQAVNRATLAQAPKAV